MSQITQQQIQQAADLIGRKIQPKRIVLYGSYAWGKPDSDSDIDFFIIKDSSKRRIERAREIREIIWGVGLPIDILVYTPEEVEHRLELGDFFIEDITQKGKTLWIKEK